MAQIDIQRGHRLGRERARALVDELAERLRERLEVSTAWQGDELVFQRSGVDGRISVGDELVRVQIRLGLMLTAFKPMLEAEIRRKLDEKLGAERT